MLLGLAGLLYSAMPLRAQFVWTGLGTNGAFTNPANWQGGNVPTGTGTPNEDVTFGSAVQQNIEFSSSLTLHNLTFTGASTTYYLGNGSNDSTLTLTGNITSIADQGWWGIFWLPVALPSGVHTIDADGASIYFWSPVSGSGSILKTGAQSIIFSANSTFTGGVTVSSGSILLFASTVTNSGTIISGPVGTGTVELMDNTTMALAYTNTVTLANDVILHNNVALGQQNNGYGLSTLKLTGTVTATDTCTTLNLADQTKTYFAGTLTADNEDSKITFTGGGFAIITGTTDSDQIDRLTADGAGIIFTSTDALPAVSIQAKNGGYIGMGRGFNNDSDNSPATLISLITNPACFSGTLGFDSNPSRSTNAFSGTIDLSGFTNANFYGLGSSTSAVLDSDTVILLPEDTDYKFGGGGGRLTVQAGLADNLDETTGLTVNSPSNAPLTLVLQGSNTFSGAVNVTHSILIFDSSQAFPFADGQTINLGPSGYVGYTENWGYYPDDFVAYKPQDLIALLNPLTLDPTSIIGFDSSQPATSGRTISDSINLTPLSGASELPYLGTTTYGYDSISGNYGLTLTGTITVPEGMTLKLTGIDGGILNVTSNLTTANGVTSVIIGHPDTAFGTGTVTLSGNNNYTGGTTLQSGQLVLGSTHALGTGALTVASDNSQLAGLSTSIDDLTICNAIDFGNMDGFTLGGDHDFTLMGTLIGSGGSIEKIGSDTVTLSGNNCGLSSSIDIEGGTMIFASDTAAGSGGMYLSDSGSAVFTSSNPRIGSLGGDSSTTLDLGSGTLKIRQSYNDTFQGTIIGTGGINKCGSSTLTLTGDNTYSGGTTISGGTLIAGSSTALGTGTITFNGGSLSVGTGVTLTNPLDLSAGATLSGNGVIGSPIVAGTNVVISPGNSPGLLTFAAGLTWASGGTYDVQVQSAAGTRGAGYDSIDVTGGLAFTATLGSPFTLNLLSLGVTGAAGAVPDFNSSLSYAWLIAHTDGLTGFTAANISIVATGFTNSLNGGSFSVTAVGNDVYLNFTPVPEPSTYALLGLGLGTMLLALRRRRA